MSDLQLADHVGAYLRLHQKVLGKDFQDEAKVLRLFAKFHASLGHHQPVSQEMAIAFATDNPSRSAERCWKRYNVVRYFAHYLAVYVPGTSTMDPRALSRHYRRTPPYIFTDEVLERLLQEALNPCKSQISAATHHTAFGLAVSTGLRVGEVAALDKTDVDLDEAVLQVRNTKFRKDRVVPIHATTAQALRDYARVRDAAFPNLDCSAFFISTTHRDRYFEESLSYAFSSVASRAGIRRPDGKTPRFHSLRHTFAVRRLIEWYRDGADVQALLPSLATYLGHVNYSSTAYYLTATPELLLLAAKRASVALREGGRHA